MSAIARFLLPGLDSTGSPERIWANGSGLTPLIWPGSIATAAAATPPASSFCAMRPPNEWPITIGLAGRSLMTSR
ncbi:MAG TPA: hypothetical protein VHZ33_31435 [Trebonia sp.]|nr:hypothetical protein [Trebonia sp.]